MKTTDKRRIVIAGGTGMIGSACADELANRGYEVIILSRSPGGGRHRTVQWDTAGQEIEENVLDGAYAVLNVTGVSIAGSRWTRAYKQKLYNSRVLPSRYLKQLASQSTHPPRVYIGVSGVGIYGNTGQDAVDESDPIGSSGFVGNLSVDWENAHRDVPAERNVIFRTGVVLGRSSEFYQRMQLPARFGMYPYFGDGRQMLSWIHIHDLVGMVSHAVTSENVNGVYNAVSGQAVQFRQFCKTHRSVREGFGIVFGVPAFVVRLVFGEMAKVLLESCNADGTKIRQTGFVPQYPSVEQALRQIDQT